MTPTPHLRWRGACRTSREPPHHCRRPTGTTSFTPTRDHQRTPHRHRRTRKEAVNNLIISGRLVRPATLRNNGDKARANFTLAVDGYTNTPTSFIPVNCFGRTAELVAEHTDKGHLIAIEGRITSGRYV